MPTATLWVTVGPLAFAIFTGGLAMAWRLGGLERQVKDMREDMRRIKDRLGVT